MNKLTAEVARQDLNHLKAWVETCGISMKEERYMQALEIALPILEQQERACQKCGGTGDVDSGAHTAGGRKVMVKCECQFEQQEQGDGWIEWRGGECPVPANSRVDIKFRDGDIGLEQSANWDWIHLGYRSDIIAYRIIPEQPTNQNGEQ